jgi:hypothetical protein
MIFISALVTVTDFPAVTHALGELFSSMESGSGVISAIRQTSAQASRTSLSETFAGAALHERARARNARDAAMTVFRKYLRNVVATSLFIMGSLDEIVL